jgi:hypothetical protein
LCCGLLLGAFNPNSEREKENPSDGKNCEDTQILVFGVLGENSSGFLDRERVLSFLI